MNSIHVVILGAGQIGQAVYKMTKQLLGSGSSIFVYDDVDVDQTSVALWNDVPAPNVDHVVDLTQQTVGFITVKLHFDKATHVINCLPFFLNEKVADAAARARCSYIDFTEDDIMADAVQRIYTDHSDLYCAVKCGLAPGFINYIGHNLVSKIHKCSDLTISVGALPRNVNWTNPVDNYNLSWSVDGLVNEYIRPCRVRHMGQEKELEALTGLESIVADGFLYEAAFTSGGIGSLVKELKHVPNVCYKTLRYPGHYIYVRDVVQRHHGDFSKIRNEFVSTFPFNKDDVIVVYAEAKGHTQQGQYIRETFSRHFVGVNGLSSIQSTTAGGGVAILELMLTSGLPKNIINHGDIPLDQFLETETAAYAYKQR